MVIARMDFCSLDLLISLSMFLLSSSSCLFDVVNMLSCCFFLSSSYYTNKISFCSLLVSSWDLSPEALATLRSICWIWNSALYSNSYWRCCSYLSFMILAWRFLDADKVPEISPIRLAYSALSLKSFWDSLNNVSFYSLISFSTSFNMLCDSLKSPSLALFPASKLSYIAFS